MRPIGCAGAWVLGVVLFGGCGLDRPAMAPVTGRIALDGRPVEGASVLFHSQEADARPGAGLTNKDGEFQITTYTVGDGGMLGNHRVTVSKIMNPMTPSERELFPLSVTKPETTTLEATVVKGDKNRFEFDLDSHRRK